MVRVFRSLVSRREKNFNYRYFGLSQFTSNFFIIIFCFYYEKIFFLEPMKLSIGTSSPSFFLQLEQVFSDHYSAEEVLNRDIACSHLRAWQMFIETIRSQLGECKFTAWPCSQGPDSFERGTCFPLETVKWSQEMGYAADRGALGIYYLPTRAESPFCGKNKITKRISFIFH